MTRRALGLIGGLLLVLSGVGSCTRACNDFFSDDATAELVDMLYWERGPDRELARRAADLVRRGAVPDGLTTSPFSLHVVIDSRDPHEDPTRTTALHAAVERQLPLTLRALLELGADVNVIDTYGQTPLFWAAGQKSREVIRILIDAGADVNLADPEGVTPLDAACRLDVTGRNARLLLRAGAQHSPRMTCSVHRTGSTERP